MTTNAGIGLPGIALISSPSISTLIRSLLALIKDAIFNFLAISKQAKWPEESAQLKILKMLLMILNRVKIN